MIDFFDIDDQIELNSKRLEFFDANYQKTQTKITVIMIFYSAFAVYLTQLLLFIGNCIKGGVSELGMTAYVALLVVFMIYFVRSIYYAAKFLIPVEIAHLDLPEFFYKDLANQYLQRGVAKTNLNRKVKDTYLQQQEDALRHNRNAFEKKSELFYSSLMNAIYALLPFLIALSIYMAYKDDTQKVIVLNSNQVKTNK